MLDIPLEIERLCVEVAISDFVLDCSTSPRKVPTIISVCRRFKAWSYPHLYRSIRFNPDYPSKLSLLRRTLDESPELALLVQELIFPYHYTTHGGDTVEPILPLCPNLSSLLSWEDDLCLDLSKHQALRRLSCFPTFFPFTPSDTLPQTFVQLTHLDLVITEGSTWYPLFAKLTKLTHLFTELPSVSVDVLSLIEHFPPSLRVCILYDERAYGEAPPSLKTIASGEVDQRIVLSSSEPIVELSIPYILRRTDEIWSDWARFGHQWTFWDEAEMIINSRCGATQIQ